MRQPCIVEPSLNDWLRPLKNGIRDLSNLSPLLVWGRYHVWRRYMILESFACEELQFWCDGFYFLLPNPESNQQSPEFHLENCGTIPLWLGWVRDQDRILTSNHSWWVTFIFSACSNWKQILIFFLSMYRTGTGRSLHRFGFSDSGLPSRRLRCWFHAQRTDLRHGCWITQSNRPGKLFELLSYQNSLYFSFTVLVC